MGRLDTVTAPQVRPRAGTTLIEVMAAMGIMAMGIAAIGSLVLATTNQNRRTLAQAQAEAVAQRELERIVALGCTNGTPTPRFCDNVRSLDRTGYDVAWGASTAPRAARHRRHPRLPRGRRRGRAGQLQRGPVLRGKRDRRAAPHPRPGSGSAGGAAPERAGHRQLDRARNQPRQAVALQTRVAP